MKIYLDNMHIRQVYNLSFRSGPVASFYAYSEILPEILKYPQGRLYTESVDGLWLAEIPFNKICDEDNKVVWENKA